MPSPHRTARAVRSRLASTAARTGGRLATGVRVAALAVPVAASAAVAQGPVTITFDDLPTALSSSRAQYVSLGYRFDCVSATDGSSCASLTSLPATHPAYTGTPALFNNNIYGITTLARVDGGAFDLTSVRLAPFMTGSAGSGFVFEGVTTAGATVTQTFTLTGTVGALTTYSFTSLFRDLRSVRFRAGGFGAAANQNVPVVDDLVIAPTATVPEPTVMALTAAGLVALAATARRRARA